MSCDLALSSSEATSSIGRVIVRGELFSCGLGVVSMARAPESDGEGKRSETGAGEVAPGRKVRGRATREGRAASVRAAQILPTRSSEGARVSSPSSHLAGQTSPGWLATYCAALTLRSSSAALRPTPSAVTSTTWITPSGSMTKVPRSARPCLEQDVEVAGDRPGGVADHGVLDLADRVEVSCHALWVKCVSVDTE